MTLSMALPTSTGDLSVYEIQNNPPKKLENSGIFNRTVYAAAHIVADAKSHWIPSGNFPHIDWDTTLQYRHHLWQNGFGIAEAMDTAQRGMGIEWQTAKQLIIRTLQEMKTHKGATAVFGAGTDHLAVNECKNLDHIYDAYMEQIGTICAYGGNPIIMASRALAKHATTSDAYINMYNRLIDNTDGQVVLHWLGEVFDPQLRGYFGSTDISQAMDTVLEIINSNTSKIEGIKISLLEQKWEIHLRKHLPAGVKMYTGDDFNYDRMIAGDSTHYSHALLGIFDTIAPVAGDALTKLANNDIQGYFDTMSPTVALSKKIFEAPTPFYKAGVVFIAWLNGHQDHFVMAGGMQSMRSLPHYAELLQLADQCHVLSNPDLAIHRMKKLLDMYGVS